MRKNSYKKHKQSKVITRKRTYTYTGLNITLHPHPTPRVYVDLFNFILKNNFAVPTGFKSHHLSLYEINFLNKEEPLDGFIGSLIRYTDITQANWTNLQTKKAAEKADLRQIIVPNYLKVNAIFFNFIFYPRIHLLVCEIDNKKGATTPSVIKRFFQTIFKSFLFEDNFTSGEVHILKDKKGVMDILNSKKLKQIEFEITRPNPDLIANLIDGQITKTLEEQKAQSMKLSYEAQNGTYLDLNENTKEIGKVAAKNGEINAIEDGDNHRTKPISTKDIEVQEKQIFLSDTPLSYMLKAVADIIIQKYL